MIVVDYLDVRSIVDVLKVVEVADEMVEEELETSFHHGGVEDHFPVIEKDYVVGEAGGPEFHSSECRENLLVDVAVQVKIDLLYLKKRYSN